MPAPRKSCERCRAQKARCIWTEGSTACVKCRRSGHECSAPVKKKVPSASFDVGNTSFEKSILADGPSTPSGYGGESTAFPLVCPTTGLTADDNTVARYLDCLDHLNRSDQAEDQIGTNAISSVSSLIKVPTTRTLSVPKLPSQLPIVEHSCGTGNCYLPPAEEGHVLLQEYLHDYNSKIPLYSPESLYILFRDCYAGVANDRPLAWVLVYTTIGMTYRLRAMSLFAAPDDTDHADWYLSTALTNLPELLVQEPCVRLVQACISIAWLLETSSRCERAPFFASTALRLATDLGLNDLPTHDKPTIDELEQRYVFWLAFFIDTHFDFAERRTGSVRMVDINTPVPAAFVSNWWDVDQARSGEPASLNIFALHCTLAILEAETAEELFSVQARRRPIEGLSVLAGNALAKLDAWRQRNALSYIDPTDIARSLYRSDIVLCVVLEAAYFRTLYQLHAARAMGDWKEKIDAFSPEALQAMMRVDARQTFEQAHRFLQLTTLMPQGNLSTTWYAMRPMAAAYCIVLSPQSFDPTNLDVHRGRLRLCSGVLKAFEAATEHHSEPKYAKMVSFCREVVAIATKL